MAVSAPHDAGLAYRVGGRSPVLSGPRPAPPAHHARSQAALPEYDQPSGAEFRRGPPGCSYLRRDAVRGQAAMNWRLAAAHGPVPPLAGGYALREQGRVLDLSPILPR